MNLELEHFWNKLDSFGDVLVEAAENSVDDSAESKIPVLYFLKQRRTVCSLMMLIQRGFVQDARILLRSQFENMIYLKSSAMDKEVFRESFRKEFTKQKKKSAYALVESTELAEKALGKAPSEITVSQELLDKCAALEIEYAAMKGNKLDIEALATECGKQIGLLIFYKTAYHEVHSTPFTIAKHFDMVKKEFIHNPDGESAEWVVCSAFGIYLDAMESLVEFYNLTPLRQRFTALKDERNLVVPRTLSPI